MYNAQERAEEAIEEDPFGAYTQARDRALVAMLYYAAVRGAEVLRHRQDERDGRQGLRWERVNLNAGTMRLLGKDQSWETAPIPSPALRTLRVLKKVQRPASDDWPVFATSHAPSKWKAAREQLDEDIMWTRSSRTSGALTLSSVSMTSPRPHSPPTALGMC